MLRDGIVRLKLRDGPLVVVATASPGNHRGREIRYFPRVGGGDGLRPFSNEVPHFLRRVVPVGIKPHTGVLGREVP